MLRKIQLKTSFTILKRFQQLTHNLHYIQGQEPEPKIREYFYYVDNQGMVIYC